MTTKYLIRKNAEWNTNFVYFGYSVDINTKRAFRAELAQHAGQPGILLNNFRLIETHNPLILHLQKKKNP